MSARVNRQWLVDSYPTGVPGPANFRCVDTAVPALVAGQVLVRSVYLSMDPFPRLRLDPASSLAPPLPLGSVMIGRGVGVVVDSAAGAYAPGDAVCGELGWQDYAAVPAEGLVRIDRSQASMTAALHLLGSSGLAPYCALVHCAALQPGETLLVTAAAGSVGIAAGQIAAALGARAVGVVRGGAQQKYLSGRFGYDTVIDGEADDADTQVAAAVPGGIDVLLDSVGGVLHDRLMEHIAVHARVVLLGFIAGYNAPGSALPDYGRIHQVIRRRAIVQGFLLPDHAAHFAGAKVQLSTWIKQGRLSMPECVTEGFGQLPEAFAALFGSAEPGKHLVRITHEQPIFASEEVA